MAKPVEKTGQKFDLNGMILTADTFVGKTGVEYETAKQAKENNLDTEIIIVKNKEYGGTSAVFNSILVE